jgi:hypothetical protein
MIFVSCANFNEYVRNYQDCLTLSIPTLVAKTTFSSNNLLQGWDRFQAVSAFKSK